MQTCNSISLKENSALLNTELRSLKQNLNWFSSKQTHWLSILSKNKQNKETPGQHSLTSSSRRSTPTRPNVHTLDMCKVDTEVESIPQHFEHGVDQISLKVPAKLPKGGQPQSKLILTCFPYKSRCSCRMPV